MATATRHWSMIATATLLVALGVTVVPAPAEASAPVAKATLTPKSVSAGSIGNVLKVTISAFKSLSGITSVQVPAGWTAPQVARRSSAGYVADARGTCGHVGKPAISGHGPWTIKVPMTCAGGKHFTIIYGASKGTTKVQAPTMAKAYSFPVSVKAGRHTYKLKVAPVTVEPGPAVHLDVTGLPAPSETGALLSVTVTARDAFGNLATHYAGTVHFTSTDSSASLPPSFTFTSAAKGAHKFAAGVMFAHEGPQSVTATDTVHPTITGSDSVSVSGVLFVATTGKDSSPGTQAKPFLTVSAAVAAAATSTPPFAVDVGGGSYNEGTGVTVTSGITIEGGFDPATWVQSASTVTTVSGAPQAVYADGATGVILENLTLDGNPPAGSGQTAYGVRAIDGSALTLDNVTVSAAAGSDGASGSTGAPGAVGGTGTAGGNGSTSDCGSGGPGGTSDAGPGGRGGDGGCNAGDGAVGTTGTSVVLEAGGTGGAAGMNPADMNGGNGDPGTDADMAANGGGGGIDELAGQTTAWVDGDGFNDARFGLIGAGGGGGGGGAGAAGMCVGMPPKCIFFDGGGGGGGGGGGAGGSGGNPGQGGGGSFGIWLWNSSITLSSSVVQAGHGGRGGTGGAGGHGGLGGPGGSGGTALSAGSGGGGGQGGEGGGGGGGGGGAGGPSIGIFLAGTSTATADASDTITFGTGGFVGLPGFGGGGGTGGFAGSDGDPGLTGRIVSS
jgi:hypothetical protein